MPLPLLLFSASTYETLFVIFLRKDVYTRAACANGFENCFYSAADEIMCDVCSLFALTPSDTHSTRLPPNIYSGCVFRFIACDQILDSPVKSFISSDESTTMTTSATGFTPDWFTFTTNEIMAVRLWRVFTNTRPAWSQCRSCVRMFSISVSLFFCPIRFNCAHQATISHACWTLIGFQCYFKHLHQRCALPVEITQKIMQFYRWEPNVGNIDSLLSRQRENKLRYLFRFHVETQTQFFSLKKT